MPPMRRITPWPSELRCPRAGHYSLGDTSLADVQLCRADGRAVDVQQEGVATRRRQLEEVELQWQVDGDRVDAGWCDGERDLAAGTANLLARRVGDGDVHTVRFAGFVRGEEHACRKGEPRDIHRDRVCLN